MARITKYLLLALIVAVAFNHAVKAQEEEAAPAAEGEAEAAAPAEAAEESEPVVEPAAEPAAEPEVGIALEEEEDKFSLGSIKKVGSWLSKFGWWNIWKGIGLKKAGDWWKWDKIFKEDWWKKKWWALEEEESRMMMVLTDPEARSMGVNAEEDATYFLAPPGFENELAKRGIAVNPSIVPVSKAYKKQHHQQRVQQRPQQYQQPLPHQLQNTPYTQSWLQRAFPSLDVYDREGGQGSEIDSVRFRPNTQSLSRRMVASLKQQIPDIIPLGSSGPNTPMYAYDQNGVMQLLSQETPLASTHQHQKYQMMNADTQNLAVLQEYQQARNGYQNLAKTKKTEIPKRMHANSETDPEGLVVPMPFPRSNSITTKDEIERALNDEQTQKMLEQYARKNWKTIRKDAIILKFVPKADMEARPSVKRQATMMQEEMPMPRKMMGDQLPEQINSAYARDFHEWTSQQERAMQMQDQQQQFRQMNPPQMQPAMEQQPREEFQQQTMQQGPMMQQQIMTPQEPRQMMIQTPQQMPMTPMIQQEPRQSFHDQTSIMQQQQVMQQQIPINHNQQHAIIQQEPRQWVQEQPIIEQMPRQWIQEQPQQQNMMIQQEAMPQSEPRQWVQEQQWMSVDPSVLEEFKPRQMTHQTHDQTQSAPPQHGFESLTVSDGGKLENKEDQHPIVSEMGPQTEDNARFFKKALLKSRPSNGAHYVTHNVNIYSSDASHGSGGYGGGYGGSPSYGRGASYDTGYSSGYESSHGGYGSQGAGYGGSSVPSYGGYGSSGSSGYESSHGGSYGGHSSHGGGYGGHSAPSYGASHGGGYGGSYGGGHGGHGYRTADTGENPTKLHQLQDPNPYRSRNTVHNHPIIQSHVDEPKMLSYSSDPPQNQQKETNTEDSLNHNDGTTTEHHSVPDIAPRLASMPKLSHNNSNTDYRDKAFQQKRQVSFKFSELGNKNVRRSRRSILSLRDCHRSPRQVPYGGSSSYSTLERIPASSLQKLREGYKENLKEITLQPNEDPAEALMRLNSQSIQEALYRANSEPIEVDGTPGQTVVHNERAGQTYIHNQEAVPVPPRLPVSSNNFHPYQNQFASKTPHFTVENARSPMTYNNGNFYAHSTRNATLPTVPNVYPNHYARNDIPNSRAYSVQQYGNPEQKYSNGVQQNVATMPQGRARETTVYERQNIGPPLAPLQTLTPAYDPQARETTVYERANIGPPSVSLQTMTPTYDPQARETTVYERPNIGPPSIPLQSMPPSYDTQFRNPVPQPSSPVVNNPTYFYQQPTVAQFQHQVPSAPIANYNQLSHPISGYNAPMRYSNPLTETADATVRDYLGGELINPSTNSVNDLMETIKTRLTTCCNKCKKQILKGINSGINSETEQEHSDDAEECLTCKASTEFLTDLKSLQNNYNKNTTPKINSRSNLNDENVENVPSSQAYKSKNTLRYYRDPNAINRQKTTQAVWTKKSRAEDEEEKEKAPDRFNDDFDYDYNLERDYDHEQKEQSHRTNQERNVKRLTTNQDTDRLHRSGYSYKSRPQTSRSANNHQYNRPGSSSNLEQYSDDDEKRRPYDNQGYKRVSDEQGQRRLTSRSGPKENKASGYDYDKQVKNESSHKNSGSSYISTTSPRFRKPKSKQEQTNESPCKKIQKQLKELESNAEKLENDDARQQDLLEKKTKLIELLYFLYEMSKCSMGEPCQTTTAEKDETSTVSSLANKSTDTPPPMIRRVKIPRKKELKTVDYSVIKKIDNNKSSSDGKKVRSVDNKYSEEVC